VKGIRQPLSLVGNIGAGKTRILTLLQRVLRAQPPAEKVFADRLLLSDTGFARASVGGVLISGLERMDGLGPRRLHRTSYLWCGPSYLRRHSRHSFAARLP
jgi:hypothetical protein